MGGFQILLALAASSLSLHKEQAQLTALMPNEVLEKNTVRNAAWWANEWR